MFDSRPGYQIKDFMRMKKELLALSVLTALVLVGVLIAVLFWRSGGGTSLDPIVKNPSTEEIAEEYLLILVNKDNKLPDDYRVDLVQLDEVKVARVMINDLVDMRDAAAADKIRLSVNSAYRTAAEQEKIYKETADKNTVMLPGYSEHETGLAIDFALESGDGREMDAKTWIWLSRNAHRYGFIQRYPEDKAQITGVSWEPWHYRYIGKKAAGEVFDRGLVLEEYLSGGSAGEHRHFTLPRHQ